MVTVEGYEYAVPVFDDNISEEGLIQGLKDWKVRQDEVDEINANAEPIEDVIPHKDLEGQEIG